MMKMKDMVPWKGRESPLARSASVFDELFEKGIGRWGEVGTFNPKVNVVEKEREVQVTAELPGLEEKDIDLTVDAHGLTLRGEKKHETKEENDSYYRMERSFGSFQRYIPLSVEVDREKVKAKFKNGVLKIELPKTGKEVQHGKKIRIEA